MYFLFGVYTVSLIALLVLGVREQRLHFANLDRIATRVLVNGIRGKSSITRLCAGALRGGGIVTVAKTTGTAARVIWPDATEEPVYRKYDIVNIVEQIDIVRRAVSVRPDALVMECMAVTPALQEINQEKLVRSQIGVLCNVREDHLEEMGPTLDDVARSLARTMPVGGVCVTAERDRLSLLEAEAARRNCRLRYADPGSVTDAEMDGFSYFTFKENVAIALAVAAEVGVERAAALRGMYAAPPDPGVLRVDEYRVEGKLMRFANVFAANDPDSTVMNFQHLMDSGAIRPPIFTVINCRPDRVERNGQMGAIVPRLLTEKLFLIGHPTRSARAGLPSGWTGKVVDLGGLNREAVEIFRDLVGEIDHEASLVAVGNIHGQGELLLEYMEELGALR
ncbi:MAG: poly-gamma-glutamate synthase PgsB [Mycobacteriales bacterium]